MNQKAMPTAAPVQEEQKAEVSTEASSKGETPLKAVKPVYSGDKGLINLTMERNTPIALKPVAELSYGNRIRIAKLHESHE